MTGPVIDLFAGGGGASEGIRKALGFPDSYVIDLEHEGRALSKSDQVRLCGNSVCPPMAAALVRSNYAEGLREEREPLPLMGEK